MEKLQKKWNNVQSRVMEKLRSCNETGGGGCSKWSDNDNLVIRILGANNPKVIQIPGAMSGAISSVLIYQCRKL